jgi:FixJ family two-component response regulator
MRIPKAGERFKDSGHAVVPSVIRRHASLHADHLQLLSEGHSVVGIAEKLSLSPKTVETYRARMMQKLGIGDFASLFRFAIQQGVSPLE